MAVMGRKHLRIVNGGHSPERDEKWVTLISTCGCGHEERIRLESAGAVKWQRGALIQDALPDLDANQREALLTGICQDCWDLLDVDDEEDVL